MENTIFNDPKVPRAYIRISMPLVMSMVVSLIYNLADTYFVARTGDTNIVAGVSLGMPIFTVLMALGNIFAQGGASLLSRMLGSKDIEGVRHVSVFCFYVTILVGIVMAALMFLFRVPVLYFIGADSDTFVHASGYYTWLAAGAPFIMLSFIHSNLLRSEGLSRESMIGSMIGTVVNIILDPIFISTLGLGAAGAAIATVIGYICVDVFYIIIVVKKSRILTVNIGKIRISGESVIQIFGVGIPAAIVNIMQSLSVALMNQFLLDYGNDKIAAMGIAMKVSMIVLLLLTGFAFGGQPLFGYYYGAKDKARLSELFRFCIRFMSVLALILTVLIFAAAPFFLRCFMDDDSIVSAGTAMLRWQVVTMVFVGIILLMSIVFQSFGKIGGSFILSICRQGVIFIIVLFIAGRMAGYTGILASQAVSDAVTVVIAAVLFRVQLAKEFK